VVGLVVGMFFVPAEALRGAGSPEDPWDDRSPTCRASRDMLVQSVESNWAVAAMGAQVQSISPPKMVSLDPATGVRVCQAGVVFTNGGTETMTYKTFTKPDNSDGLAFIRR
jgi:hypothetical protein